MALPSNISFGTVTGRFMRAMIDGTDPDRDPDGVPLEGLIIRFTPSAKVFKNITAAGGPVTILSDPIAAITNEDGLLVGPDGIPGIRLIATDDEDLNPTGWTWRVSIAGSGLNINFSFTLPSDETVDLTTLVPVPPNPGQALADWAVAVESARTIAEDTARRVIDEEADWRGSIQSGTSLDAVTEPGRYWTGSSHSTGLGTLLVAFSGGSVIQQDAFTANGRWLHRTRDSSGWTAWRRLDNGRSDTLSSSVDLDTLTDPTAWVYSATEGTAATNHLPEDGFRGHIVVRGSAGYNWQTALSMDNGERWERTRIGTSSPWTEWRKAAWATKPDYSIRHAMIADRHAARISAPVEVGTATPVAFVWDDWPALMRDLGIVTTAEANEIPITYAIPSRALEEPYASILGGVGITWAEIDGWVQDGWVELANHSATHTTILPASSMYDEIVTSLAELQAHSPTKPITSWVMPTVQWEGFNSGATPDEWAGEAGQLILGHHAYATGKMEVLDYRTQPMTGTPIQGQDRIWVEAADLTTSSRQGLITRHYGTNRGVIISAHANNIGKPGRWTIAEVEAFFAWIAAERDAGRIEPMFLSQWAWAKSEN